MTSQTERPTPLSRRNFSTFRSVSTRWSDNDIYGHVNNVVYYSWFDAAVNAHLIEHGGLNIHEGEVIGLVVQTHCDYFSPLAFPQAVEIGIRVAHIGNSSVRYELGVFAEHAPLCAAHGHFIHVYVDRKSRKPVGLPAALRVCLETIRN